MRPLVFPAMRDFGMERSVPTFALPVHTGIIKPINAKPVRVLAQLAVIRPPSV